MNLLETAKSYVRGSELLFEWLGNGVPVDKSLAETRALKCSQCLKNDTTYRPVEAVSRAVKELVAFKNCLNLSTVWDEQLGTCSACLCPSATKIWVDLERLLRYTDKDELAKFEEVQCWIIKERDNKQYSTSN